MSLPRALTVSLLVGLLLLGIQVSLPSPAQAVFIDSTTGLQWLEFSHSNGRSYNQVSSQFGPGGEFEGYRYATAIEVQNLFASQGVTMTGETTSANYGPVSSLFEAFGVLQDHGDYIRSMAITGTMGPSWDGPWHRNTELFSEVPGGGLCTEGNCEARAVLGCCIFDDETWAASWLVREAAAGGSPVPEPASLLLLASGVAGLVARRRRT